jgi:hypothetical protein
MNVERIRDSGLGVTGPTDTGAGLEAILAVEIHLDAFAQQPRSPPCPG